MDIKLPEQIKECPAIWSVLLIFIKYDHTENHSDQQPFHSADIHLACYVWTTRAASTSISSWNFRRGKVGANERPTGKRTDNGILLDRMSLSVKNGWLDEQNRVFIIFTIEDVKRALCCADNKATKLLRELEKFGLIERKRRGLGKPSLVYVKNFSAESSKSIFQNRDFHDSGGFKNASQDPSKSRCNKTKENDTEMSETDPFYSEEADGMSKRTQLEEYFSQSLEIDLLLRLCPDDEDTIYQIVDLLVDTCATNRKLLHIAGDDKPAEVVRSRFMKLNADHIRFVLKCLAENSSPIRNMKQYLLASLYNAPTTMQLSINFCSFLCPADILRYLPAKRARRN